MKTIEVSTASKTLAEYTSELDDDFVVLTSNNKPIAALVSLKSIDPEALALSTNSQFLKIIEQARQEVAAGQTISLRSMKKEYGL
jgi:PHD/YefM family antitoxin component YafN of YafNO toxin-antitoxin module